jgi:hypothetical protein
MATRVNQALCRNKLIHGVEWKVFVRRVGA